MFKLFFFLDHSSIVHLLKEQITHLHLSFGSGSLMTSTHEFSKNVCVRIFALGEKLKTLDFRDFEFPERSLSFDNLPLSACHSSTLLVLNISVSTFDDCLTLLDGRLPQMSTFNVIIRNINKSLLSIDHPVNTSDICLDYKRILSYFRCFCSSLNVFH